MKRRDFLGMAAASVFVPQFGRWYRQSSGLVTPGWELMVPTAHSSLVSSFVYVNGAPIRPQVVVDHMCAPQMAYLRAARRIVELGASDVYVR